MGSSLQFPSARAGIQERERLDPKERRMKELRSRARDTAPLCGTRCEDRERRRKARLGLKEAFFPPVYLSFFFFFQSKNQRKMPLKEQLCLVSLGSWLKKGTFLKRGCSYQATAEPLLCCCQHLQFGEGADPAALPQHWEGPGQSRLRL